MSSGIGSRRPSIFVRTRRGRSVSFRPRSFFYPVAHAYMNRRILWALLLTAVVLLGTLELHPAGEASHALIASAESFYSLSAKHPGQPAHFEASQETERPVCPFCIHQLQTSGACLRTRPVVSPPAPRLAPASDLSSATAGGSHRPSGARGPPSFS